MAKPPDEQAAWERVSETVDHAYNRLATERYWIPAVGYLYARVVYLSGSGGAISLCMAFVPTKDPIPLPAPEPLLTPEPETRAGRTPAIW
jgi:hypothetical protein